MTPTVSLGRTETTLISPAEILKGIEDHHYNAARHEAMNDHKPGDNDHAVEMALIRQGHLELAHEVPGDHVRTPGSAQLRFILRA